MRFVIYVLAKHLVHAGSCRQSDHATAGKLMNRLMDISENEIPAIRPIEGLERSEQERLMALRVSGGTGDAISHWSHGGDISWARTGDSDYSKGHGIASAATVFFSSLWAIGIFVVLSVIGLLAFVFIALFRGFASGEIPLH
ncbi:MAG: hypothetical protein CMM01_16735 [Rhodopirellula sp.]|nr:hypothetical protein [Rhodopirellula sp.]